MRVTDHILDKASLTPVRRNCYRFIQEFVEEGVDLLNGFSSEETPFGVKIGERVSEVTQDPYVEQWMFLGFKIASLYFDSLGYSLTREALGIMDDRNLYPGVNDNLSELILFSEEEVKLKFNKYGQSMYVERMMMQTGVKIACIAYEASRILQTSYI